MNFETLKIKSEILEIVRELGYSAMTPIQAESIPALLRGEDVLGQSKTGSGKTAAFAIPMLHRVNVDKKEIQALVLCPTRELCAQVAREIRKFGRRFSGFQVLVLAGGASVGPQLDALEKGVHVIVGTPGRVLDHFRRGSIRLSQNPMLVLDEADRMLDMGFQDEMESILKQIPKDRQTALFSATFPEAISELSDRYQKNALKITVDSTDGDSKGPDIDQTLVEVDAQSRLPSLLEILSAECPESTVVFCNLKVTVSDLSRDLSRLGVSVVALQGDLDQFERDQAMARFRNKSASVLVATDVAARGIDIEDLDLVVNYDFPIRPEIYVHRIGRTGRAGKTGRAISLVAATDWVKVRAVESELKLKLETQNLESSQGQFQFPEPRFATLLISGGRKDKVRPGDLLGALTGDAGRLLGSEVGKIEIHDTYSYVAVASERAAATLGNLRDGLIKGRRFRVSLVR